MEIRFATQEDLPVLCALAQLMCEESPTYSTQVFNMERVAQHISMMHVVFILDDDEGEPVGMMGGYMATSPIAFEHVATEGWLYILSEHRGARHAINFIRKFEQWAKDHGAKRIKVGTTTQVAADRTKALYERLGFIHTGYTLSKEL